MASRSPANEVSIQRYARHAANYDASAAFTQPLRMRTIAHLGLREGDVVLDVGAGTGLSYGPLSDAVGRTGHVMGFEQSREMFDQAVARVERNHLDRVWHQCARAEDVTLPMAFDAVLFNYVHDIARTPEALNNIFRHAKPGARVAVAGMKFFPWWTGPLNVVAWLKNRPYNAMAADLWSPWDLIQPHCDAWAWESTQWGMGYIAHGRLKRQGPCP